MNKLSMSYVPNGIHTTAGIKSVSHADGQALNVGRATAEEVQRSNPKRPHLREAETYKCSKLEKKMPLLI